MLLDTPGLHKPRSRLGDYMVKVVRESLEQVEAALLLVEPIAHVGEPEKILLQRIREEHLPCVLCINKIDTVEKKDDLLAVIAAYSQAFDGFRRHYPHLRPDRRRPGGPDGPAADLCRRRPPAVSRRHDHRPARRRRSAPRSSGRKCCCAWKRRSPTARRWR